MTQTITATILVAGRLDRYTIITDAIVEQTARELNAGARRALDVRDDAGNVHVATIVAGTARTYEQMPGVLALRVDLKVPDELYIAAAPAALSGADVSADDRARQMPTLERQVTQGNVE